MIRASLVLAVSVPLSLLASRPAAAAEPEPVPGAAPAEAAATPPAAAAPAPAAPAAAPATPPPAGDPAAATAGVPMVDAAVQAASPARYGFAVRGRWASVPKWLLGLFLDESVPLSSYTIGAEFFRRSGNFDVVFGLAWQDLTPRDGNWLGTDHPADLDTDFVQFKGFGAVSFDTAFILRTDFNEYVSLHYGGGVGIGVVTGKMWRISNHSPGCAGNPGSVADCYPVGVPPNTVNCGPTGPCSQAQLDNSRGGVDSPTNPSQFEEGRVPAAYPIVNLITGLTFRFPNVKDFEMRVDGGYFFPYFFLGAGLAYRI